MAEVDMKRRTQIVLEVALGRKPERPDTPEEARIRAVYQQDVDEIRARGGIVDIPFVD